MATYSSISNVVIESVRFEQHREALGIGAARPRLSWISQTTQADWRQIGYEIEAYYSEDQLREQTNRVESDQSVLVEWPFAPLSSRERLLVRVRVWGNDGQISAWSTLTPVEAGLLEPDDWSARFITPDAEKEGERSQPLPLLRREFKVRAGVAMARLYVTALGVYEALLNGQPVGDQVLAPGWTSYDHRLRYQTFDVTNLLHEGSNVIGALLGDGWYRSTLNSGLAGRRSIYGKRLALLAQLEITYVDGSCERIVTDELWRTMPGPILASDLYDGETYDARLEFSGWSEPGYEEGQNWSVVALLERNLATLVAPSGPSVRRTELVAPVSITVSPSGSTIIDFGQNLAGRLRLMAHGESGQTITLRHAELLVDGELYTRPLGTAQATDHYTLRGGGEEIWEPRFTFHGFRYAEVEGWPGELRAEDVCAVVCHSDMERTGWFECSDPLINRLHENVVWGMRSNFLDIPTDCPQRAERLGWTGDIQVFAPTASFLYDISGFLTSWLADLAAEQKMMGGTVPHVVPNTLSESYLPMAGWGDAAIIVPWVLYQRFGDQDILETQFESMQAWIDFVDRHVGETHLWNKGYQYGDWLDPSAPPERAEAARTDSALVATAYFARSTELLGQIAGLLGKSEAEARYLALASQIRAAFAAEFLTPNGGVLSDAETGYALVLQFGLLTDPAQRRHAGRRLAELVRRAGYHISTGFLGTPLICDALCDAGYETVAYRLLTQRECPSWLFPVTMGATTIWERWDALRPDGTPNPGQMLSYNHYAFGAVADWLHRAVAGLAAAEPGYRRLSIRPRPGGGLNSAQARHRTPYGLAEVSWQIAQGQLTVDAIVPPNTTAFVQLPGNDAIPFEIGSGTHRWSMAFSGRPSITLDNPLNAFFDDEQAWDTVLRTITSTLPGMAAVDPTTLRNALRGYDEIPARYVLMQMPQADKMLPVLEAALAELDR
ncbi:MAG: family 78 glycoside hydrolase catalytic domain [Ktedonobacteraceae bacterium]|nr:family 78 glycoside hydrolase catalytic domain [Ktedonobacteraceae bacterium]